MQRHASLKIALFVSVTAVVMLAGPAPGAPAKDPVAGDWQVEVSYDGGQMASVIALSRDKAGELTGQWISLWGVGELSKIRYEDNKLSFTQSSRFGDRDFTANFTGTIEKTTLSGTLSSERGDARVEGKRLRPVPQAAGAWETKVNVNGQEYAATLLIQRRDKGGLTAAWQSQWGEHQISEVAFKEGALTFKRHSKVQDREWESAFEGTIKGQGLTGAFTSKEGKIPLQGTRVGGALVGIWDLKTASDAGTRVQRLRVYPDLSGLYGPLAVQKVKLEGNRVSFTTTAEFGDQKYEIGFAGTLDGGTLRGEVTTSRGSRTVEGVKRGAKPVRQAARRPDVIFVPTPQEDIFTLDLSAANVITLYLLPSLNVKLIPQLEKLKPGSRIVSHDFDMQGVTPDQVVTLTPGDGHRQHTIYLWTTPLKKE